MQYKYFLINNSRLCRAAFDENIAFSLCRTAEEWLSGEWVPIPSREVNDLLLGYDPLEEPGYQLGNFWLMDMIREISAQEAAWRIEK